MTYTLPPGWKRSDKDAAILTRPMKDFEVFFTSLCASVDVPQFPITGSILLDLQDYTSTDALLGRIKKAWKCLTLQFPILRLQAKSDFTYEYPSIFDQKGMDKWADDTVQSHHFDSKDDLSIENVVDINNAYSSQPLPDKYNNWSNLRVIAPWERCKRFSITLRMSHNLVDAGSVTLLIDELLRLLSRNAEEPLWNDAAIRTEQISRLPVAMSDLMPVAEGQDVMDPATIKSAYGRSKYQHERISSRSKAPFGRAGHKVVRLDEDDSARFHSFAKKHGITVSALLHSMAVFRCALKEGIDTDKEELIYTSEIPVDPRSALPSLKEYRRLEGSLSSAVAFMAKAAMENIYSPVRSLDMRRKLALNNTMLAECLAEASREGHFDFNTHLCEMFSDSILDGGRYIDSSAWSEYDGMQMKMLDYEMSAQIANGAGLLFRAWNVNKRTYICIDWAYSYYDATLPSHLLNSLHKDMLSLIS